MEHKVPFFAKLARQGVAFIDSVSGLYVSGDSVVKVTVLTPETRRWLREGGLVPCNSEGKSLSVVAAETSTEDGALETPDTGTDAGTGEGSENANQGGDESGDQDESIEDLLKGEEDAPAPQPTGNTRTKNRNR
jgi:hypothetical protein